MRKYNIIFHRKIKYYRVVYLDLSRFPKQNIENSRSSQRADQILATLWEGDFYRIPKLYLLILINHKVNSCPFKTWNFPMYMRIENPWTSRRDELDEFIPTVSTHSGTSGRWPRNLSAILRCRWLARASSCGPFSTDLSVIQL